MFNKYKTTFYSFMVVAAMAALAILIISRHKPELEYIYKKSYHHAFNVEGDWVYLRNDITVKNNSSQQLEFYMIANTKDEQLVSENQIYAYNLENLDEKQLFTIAPHATETYCNVIFKGSSTGKTVKANRLPPKEITFQSE